MTIGERIRLVRKETGLNQTDFGEKVGLRQSSLGQIESGARNATDRTIILICEKYSVRKEWLRDGIEPMFVESDSTIISQLSNEYGLDEFEKVLIEGFLKMKPEDRAVIKTYVRNIIDDLTARETAQKRSHQEKSLTIDEEVELYRKQLLLEKEQAERSSVLSNEPGAKMA